MEILDKFTELQTELQTELKLRKKQYEYYRDKLLTFSEEEREKWGVRDVRIGDVCMILRGKRLTKRDLVDGGDYPVFHGGKEPIGYYHEKNRDANTTMIINTGDCGCVSWSDKDFWSSDGCFCVKTPQDILNKFIYYTLLNKEYEIKSKTRTAGIPTLDKKDVENITIPIPPLSRQKEIVEILDKFDTLVNDISKGLPREIELRRKQYEYYRERLVNFG